MAEGRQAFGIAALDQILGGGLLPGTLTVIAGATGMGKTQLGLRWADAGLSREGQRGVICDLTSRGDAQNHFAYARDQFGWEIQPHDPNGPPDLDAIWRGRPGDYLNPFQRSGRRVTRRDLEPEEWHIWKTELGRVLRGSVAWLYGNFVQGARRVVIDGVEPTERFADSIQFELFEYLYHRAIREEHDWLAREVFRERFREMSGRVDEHPYDHKGIGCLYLYTTPQVMLDEMITQPIGEGDIFANANTIIYLGRTKTASGIGRGLFVSKHRGSACGDEILPYRLTDSGFTVAD